jgi:hypothetical protein
LFKSEYHFHQGWYVCSAPVRAFPETPYGVTTNGNSHPAGDSEKWIRKNKKYLLRLDTASHEVMKANIYCVYYFLDNSQISVIILVVVIVM